MTPNLSLNADFPCAGLRPRTGPPVSLYGWAAFRSYLWRSFAETRSVIRQRWR